MIGLVLISYTTSLPPTLLWSARPYSMPASWKARITGSGHRFSVTALCSSTQRHSSSDHTVEMRVQFVLGAQQASEWNAVILCVPHENRKSFWSWPVLRAINIERIDPLAMEGSQQLISREHAGRVVEATQSG